MNSSIKKPFCSIDIAKNNNLVNTENLLELSFSTVELLAPQPTTVTLVFTGKSDARAVELHGRHTGTTIEFLSWKERFTEMNWNSVKENTTVQPTYSLTGLDSSKQVIL